MLLSREKKKANIGHDMVRLILYYLLLKMNNTPGIQLYNEKMTTSISHYPPEIWYQFTAQGKKKS